LCLVFNTGAHLNVNDVWLGIRCTRARPDTGGYASASMLDVVPGTAGAFHEVPTTASLDRVEIAGFAASPNFDAPCLTSAGGALGQSMGITAVPTGFICVVGRQTVRRHPRWHCRITGAGN
jgi:hypothetical protein